MQVMKYPPNSKSRKIRRMYPGFFEKVPRVQRMYKKVGRNDLCPCGSGKKFKYCEECYKKYGESRQYFTDEMIKEAAKRFEE